MKSKKGVGVGQVFIFIIAGITFALIMIFGYKVIAGFLQSGEEVAFAQFKGNLENSIKKIYPEFQAIRIKEYRTPLRYEQICFVNMDNHYPGDTQCDFDAYACDVWKDAWETGSSVTGYDAVEENVFLQPQALKGIKVYKISIADDENELKRSHLCRKIVDGSFSLMLEGKGDRTELSEPPEG